MDKAHEAPAIPRRIHRVANAGQSQPPLPRDSDPARDEPVQGDHSDTGSGVGRGTQYPEPWLSQYAAPGGLVGDSAALVDSNALKQGWIVFEPLDHGPLPAILIASYRAWVSCAPDHCGIQPNLCPRRLERDAATMNQSLFAEFLRPTQVSSLTIQGN
jgi:hypothetical protein